MDMKRAGHNEPMELDYMINFSIVFMGNYFTGGVLCRNMK